MFIRNLEYKKILEKKHHDLEYNLEYNLECS